jgi:hypothetical protein
MINLNPELILMRNDEVTVQSLAREYSAKQALRVHYEEKANLVGMSLKAYCARFNVKISSHN